MTEPEAARKIAVLLQSLEGGGAQRRVVELVDAFVRSGRRVDLILADPAGELRDRLPKAARIIELDAEKPQASLVAYLDEERPDALLAGAAAVHPLAVAAAAGVRRPALVLRASSHPLRYIPWSFPRQRLLEHVRRRLRLRRYAAADLVVAVSQDIAEAIRASLPAAPVVVIPNPVVTNAFLAGADAAIKLPWQDVDGIPLIISIGRFALAKDFPTLLRAFALVRKQRVARLIILGDGSRDEREALVRLACKLGVASDVALPGTTNAVAAWLRRADLFVSSSLWEGSAGALIEALAMGCPVVATSSVGSARDLVETAKVGRLVPPRRPRALARAILAELDTSRDRSLLQAVAAPYAAVDRARDYLNAIDACVARLKRRRIRVNESG